MAAGSRGSGTETSDRGERGPKSWGSLARRGAGKVGEGPKPPREADAGRSPAGRVKDTGRGEASKTWRKAVDSARPERRPSRDVPPKTQAPPRDLESWVLVEEIRDEAEHAVERAGTTNLRRDTARSGADDRAGAEIRKQLGQAVGASRGERVEKRLRDVAKDFEAERFPEAARRLRPLSEQAPSVAAVRELYGLTLYRQAKWRLAAKELEAFRTLSGSTEQHPVLADCYRALHQWRRVEELWDELRESSPGGELVTEGRIVMAGALADRGKVPDAIRLLEQGWRFPKRPRVHHLRRAYALADLYERAGDVTRARELFSRIRAADPSFADVRTRLRSLG
jgi:tetratricopeptide (TPR) repeat protein